MSEYDNLIGKTITAVDESTYGCDVRLDFSDGTRFCLLVGGGDGSVTGEWIDDQEIADRKRYIEIIGRVHAMQDRARVHSAGEVVRGWNGWLHIAGETQISEEERIFMEGRKS